MTQLAAHGTIAIPEATSTQKATSIADCDAAVADVAAHSKSWFEEPAKDMIGLLERLTDSVLTFADEWVKVSCEAKHYPVDSPAAGEDWASVMITGRYLRMLQMAITDIAAGRKPSLPGKPHPVAAGHTAIPAFPVDGFDKIAFSGFSGDIWLRRGVTGAEATERQAQAWFGGGAPGVSLVLGAGNQSSIPITDALDRLFISRHPVILKMNPVNDYAGPIFEKICAELIDRGVLRIVYGGAEVGTHLVRHEDVTEVHVTGSDKTFEAIVFGGGPEGLTRKAAKDPLVTKPVTGELGNVSPVIVVPGPWTAKDISFQAQNIASMLTNNAGFNCIALRALITSNTWSQRDEFLEAMRQVLKDTEDRYAYYPGARARWDAFTGAHPESERFGQEEQGCVPWTMIPGLRTDTKDEIAFTTEAFNGVFGEVGIDATDTVDFIRKAVEFSNDGLWGTLGCSIVVHPKSMKDPAINAAVEQAIADLKYGTIGVNIWSAVGFTLGTTPWGAYPGHTIDDVQSGIGFVHNSIMLAEEDIEKTVVRGPFRMPIKPTWFASNKNAHKAGELAAKLMTRPSWGKVPALVTTALRG
ncbi:MAG TPA: aldehyde dehydrogenase family protein [Mycobacteriales bacterium]|nr:aldehyde dehydrogenase family protein [Mycobacteriales bacterium]